MFARTLCFAVDQLKMSPVDDQSKVVSEVDIQTILAQQVNKARKLLPAPIKPLLEDIPIEKRLDLARTLAREENINYLAAQIQLRKPIVDETPPWEYDPHLLKWLEIEEAATLAERVEQEHAAEEGIAKLLEAETQYELYATSERQETTAKQCQFLKSEITGSTRTDICKVRLRFSISEDDINWKDCATIDDEAHTTRHRPSRGQPSFVVDTSQSQTKLHWICSNCGAYSESLIFFEDLAAFSDTCAI